MKMAKVVKLAKQARKIDLWQKYEDEVGYTGPQWLNTGYVVYNLDGMPRISSEEEFLKIFDIKEGKCTVQIEDLPSTVNFSRWADGEKQAEPMRMTIGIQDDILRLFQYEGGCLFVRQSYLEPFGDKEDIMYSVRGIEKGSPYLCVQDGLILGAIIMPHNVTYATKKMMKNILDAAVKELERSLAWDRVNEKK